MQSVLDQTYHDFEIVIVDDGSNDPATRHMLASYRRPRTRIVRMANGGLASARNRGFEESSGRYLSFLDADDILEPAFLERAVTELERDPECGFASCWLRAFGLSEFDWTPSSCTFPELLVEDTVCTAALTRREAMMDVGGFDTEMPVAGYEDWDAAISLVEKGHYGTIIPDFLFRYRIRSGSMTSVCTQPKNHSRLFEYLLSKHRSTYEGRSKAVIALLEDRIGAFQESLAVATPRPSISADASALDEILALEDHRKSLEDLAHRATAVPGDKSANLDWGSLRKTEPVSRAWGLDRGTPVDRYYIERFLDQHAAAITGSVLEVKDPGYTSVHGRGVTATEVVDIAPDNIDATLIADLSIAGSLPAEKFDCFVLTQTIHVIYDIESVVRSAHETLRPGGVVLATLPCMSRVDYESGLGGDFWRFTAASASRLFGDAFGGENVEIAAFGNVLACTAFLQGIAAEELSREELDKHDPYFPLVVGVLARKEVTPTKQRGNIEGHLDVATCRRIAGWALDPSNVESPLEVEVLIGERKRGSVVADGHRHDLELAGKGQGRCAFEWAAHDFHDSIGQLVTLRVGGSDTAITGERTLECVCERRAIGAEGASDKRGAGAGRTHGKGSGAVLVYHSVGSTDGDEFALSITEESFRAHMSLLRREFTTLPLMEFIERAERGSLPPRAISVTFDDGYVDNLELASPILRDLEVPATFFITTGGLPGATTPWWEVLELALSKGARGERDLEIAIDGGVKLRLSNGGSAEAGQRALFAARDALARTDLETRERVIDEITAWAEMEPPFAGRRLMSEADVAALAEHDQYFLGAHSVNHLWLPEQRPDTARAEILNSRRQLEDIISREVTLFSYPYGAYDDNVVAMTAAAGYRACVTVDSNGAGPEIDPYRIPRIDGSRIQPDQLEARLVSSVGSS